MRRRTFLTACSAGVCGLAGCESLSDLGEDESPDVDTQALAEEFDSVSPPSGPFPTEVLAERADAHEQRASDLLADVPAEPSIPNEAVVEELDAERPTSPPPATPATDQGPLQWLDDWRDYRSDAATVWGAYRAATGTDDSDLVAEHRRGLGQELGAVRADVIYRGSDPVTAVVSHAPIEELLRESHEHLQPRSGYPDDPVAAPIRAGAVLGHIERASGALADARALQSIVSDDGEAHWGTLTRGIRRLQRSLAETADGLEPYVRQREDAFGSELDGAHRRLFSEAVDTFEFRRQAAREADDDGRYATAILENGRALIGAELLSTVVTGIREGRFPDEPSADEVRDAAVTARETLADTTSGDHPALTGALTRPAVFRQHEIIDEMAEGHRDGGDAYAAFTHAAMYARGVPEASQFVAAQLTPMAER